MDLQKAAELKYGKLMALEKQLKEVGENAQNHKNTLLIVFQVP